MFAVVLGLSFFSLFAVGCGGSQSRTSASRSQALVLNELRQSLGRGGAKGMRVRGLVGASRTMVRSMLGQPQSCGDTRRAVACHRADDWTYRGGSRSRDGGTLRVRFDSLGHVSSAEWI